MIFFNFINWKRKVFVCELGGLGFDFGFEIELLGVGGIVIIFRF